MGILKSTLVPSPFVKLPNMYIIQEIMQVKCSMCTWIDWFRFSACDLLLLVQFREIRVHRIAGLLQEGGRLWGSGLLPDPGLFLHL